MGFVICQSPCGACRAVFAYNPMKVPSVLYNGVRVAICRQCVEAANRFRRKRGLEEFTILPGAYDGADESEMVWD